MSCHTPNDTFRAPERRQGKAQRAFLSGYMSGLVYGRPGYPRVAAHCLRRALQIYGFHLLIVVCLITLSLSSSIHAGHWRGYVPLYSESP